jgi:hypothetical protein
MLADGMLLDHVAAQYSCFELRMKHKFVCHLGIRNRGKNGMTSEEITEAPEKTEGGIRCEAWARESWHNFHGV